MGNSIYIISQAFYGNRTETRVKTDNIDRFIMGHLDDKLNLTKEVDRTIVKIHNDEHIVIVYNKHQEKEKLEYKAELSKGENYKLKPLVFIPEYDLKIYSRCIVCRINENNEFEDLREEDFEKFMKYLAK